MSKPEGTGFRKKLFGGFNNKDVIDYIANSARCWKNEKEALERSLADSEKRATAAALTVEKEKQEKAVLASDCQRKTELIRSHEGRITLLTGEVTRLTDENEALVTANAGLSASVAEARTAAAAAESALSEKTGALEAELAALTGENARLSAEFKAASDKAAALEAELAALKEKAAALEAENLSLSSRSDSLKTFADGIAAMLAGLNGKKPE